MAFTILYKEKTVFGNKRIVTGFYGNTAGSTGGTINTELDRVENLFLTPATSTPAQAHVWNISGPSTNGDVVIVTPANEYGNFMAIGL
jgi:hypothetical protein